MDSNVDQAAGSATTAGLLATPTGLRPDDPSLPLDHRWRRAGLPPVRGTRLVRPDHWVKWARRFRVALDLAGGDLDDPRLGRADPGILAACRLSRGPERRRWEAEARLLAGQPDGEIAARLGIEPGAVAAYESLFFDVRAKLGCADWVVIHAIGPRLHEGFGVDDHEMIWKLFGYHGGPLVLELVLAATGGGSPGDPAVALDPGLVDEARLAIAIRATRGLEGPLDWARLDDLSRRLHSGEMASAVSAVSGPVVATPPAVEGRPGELENRGSRSDLSGVTDVGEGPGRGARSAS